MALINWWKFDNNIIDDLNKENTDLAMQSNKTQLDYAYARHSNGINLSNYTHLFIKNPFIQKEAWSISFWVKDIGTDDWCNIITFSDRTQRIEIYNNGTNWHWYVNGTGHSPLFPSVLLKDGLTKNTWHHVVLTYNHGVADFYLDNINIKHTTNASAFVDDGINKIYFGSRGTGQYAKIVLSDLRLYDNTLSIYDINDLYLDCIAYYSFDSPYFENTTNLVTKLYNGGQTRIETSDTIITSGANLDTYFRLGLAENLIAGHTYTISCDAEIPTGYFEFGLAGQSRAEPYMKIINGHNSYTFVCTDKIASKNPLLFDDIHREFIVSKFTNFQIVEKDHDTPYCKTERPAIMISDNSGWDHSAASTNIKLTSNTPIGSYALEVCSDNSYFTLNNDFFTNDSPIDFTISFWAYFDDVSKNQNVFTCREQPGNGVSLFVLGRKFRFDCGYSAMWTLESGPIDKQWAMYTFVAKNNIREYYLNGVLIQKTEEYHNAKNHKWIDNTFYFGHAFANKIDNGYQLIANSKLAEFKIYDTALADFEIKELYDAHTKISNKNQLISTEFIEQTGSLVEINKSGIVNMSELDESNSEVEFYESEKINATEFIEC